MYLTYPYRLQSKPVTLTNIFKMVSLKKETSVRRFVFIKSVFGTVEALFCLDLQKRNRNTDLYQDLKGMSNIDSLTWKYPIPLLICTWISKNQVGKTQVRRTGFLVCKNQFRNLFLQATQAVKITDKRRDVWSQDFIIWKINSGLWALVWAGL